MTTLSGLPWSVNHHQEVRMAWKLICLLYPATTPTRWRLLHELVDDYGRWVIRNAPCL